MMSYINYWNALPSKIVRMYEETPFYVSLYNTLHWYANICILSEDEENWPV